MAETVLGEAEGRRWHGERYGKRQAKRCRKAARRRPVLPDELLRRIVATLADARKRLAEDDEQERSLWSQVDRIARAGGEEWRRLRERVQLEDSDLYQHWVRCAAELYADSQKATALTVVMLAMVSA